MGKKKILLMADVENWAWGIKSRNIQKNLSNDFDIDVEYMDSKKYMASEDGNKLKRNKYDLYLTFTPRHVAILKKAKIHRDRIITGITAHSGAERHCVGKKFRSKSDGKNLDNDCAGFHVNSRMLYDFITYHEVHSNVFYTPNGVNTKLFPQKKYEKKHKIVLGHVGKLMKRKGVSDYILPLSKKTGLTLERNHNSFKESTPYDEMYKIYHKIDIYVVASTMDGTPNPALEASSCGVPVISNKIGNMPEFIEDDVNGFLLDELDVKLYVDKVEYLKKHYKRVIEMGEAARKTAEQWDWSNMVKHYKKMFEELT